MIRTIFTFEQNTVPTQDVSEGDLWLNHDTGIIAKYDGSKWNTNMNPVGPVSFTAPTSINMNTTGTVSFSGATDPNIGDTLTYKIYPGTGTQFTYSKTSGIAANESVTLTAPTVGSNTNITFGVVAVDQLGAESAKTLITITDNYIDASLNRGVFGGGAVSGYSTALNSIDYLTLVGTSGNASAFGQLSASKSYISATSNSSNNRGVFGGGLSTAGNVYFNDIDYITISSTGNSTLFGQLTSNRDGISATSNSSNNRGVFGCGYGPSSSNILDYITISSTGNALLFGQLTAYKGYCAATSNGTSNTGVFGGGQIVSNSQPTNAIDYINFNSGGNASNLCQLTATKFSLAATSNGTNNTGVFGGGYNGTGVFYNSIDYLNIPAASNASNFGNLTTSISSLSATSNSASGLAVFGGGDNSNLISYINISTLGNASNFGFLTGNRTTAGATSNT